MKQVLLIVGMLFVSAVVAVQPALAVGDPFPGDPEPVPQMSIDESVGTDGAVAADEEVSTSQDVDEYLIHAARAAMAPEARDLTTADIDAYFAHAGQPLAVPNDPLLTGIRASVLTTQIFDLSTTTYGIGTGRVKEANPALSWAADHPIALAGLKLGGAAVMDWSVRRLAKDGHRKKAILLGVVLSTTSMAISLHNMSEIRATR